MGDLGDGVEPPARQGWRSVRGAISPRAVAGFLVGVVAALAATRLEGAFSLLAGLVVIALGLAAVILLLVVVPELQLRHLGQAGALTAKEAFDVRNDTRTTIIQFLGGLFFVMTVYVGYRNYDISHRTLAIGQDNVRIANKSYELAQRQLELAEDGRITDRFSKAVEQLGSDSLTVRLGGLYALERVGRDARAEQSTVVDVVSAFVRLHAAWNSKENRPIAPDEAQLRKLSIELPGGGETSLGATRGGQTLLRIDVQSALTILGRGGWQAAERVDLSGTDLRGANLYRAHLPRGLLLKGHLELADLREAELAGAQMEGAYLTDTQLADARLTAANLFGAYLSRADLARANLHGAALSAVDLTRANLSECDLGAADLDNANLSGASLRGADLSQARLTGVDLSDLREWRTIKSVRLAFVARVRRAPEGFLDWARENGAVIDDEAEWRRLVAEQERRQAAGAAAPNPQGR